MAFTNSSGSPPTVIDDDIHRTVDNILKAATSPDDDNAMEVEGVQPQPLGAEVYTRLLESLSVAMQRERNGWKDKLHTTLQVGG